VAGGYQWDSHNADTYFMYECDACGGVHDGREAVNAEEVEAFWQRREAYDLEMELYPQ